MQRILQSGRACISKESLSVYRAGSCDATTPRPCSRVVLQNAAALAGEFEDIPIFNMDSDCCNVLFMQPMELQLRQNEGHTQCASRYPPGITFHDVASALEHRLAWLIGTWAFEGRTQPSVAPFAPAKTRPWTADTAARGESSVCKPPDVTCAEVTQESLDVSCPGQTKVTLKHPAVRIPPCIEKKRGQMALRSQVLCSAAVKATCDRERGWTSEKLMKRVADRRWLDEAMHKYALKQRKHRSRASSAIRDDFLHMKAAGVLHSLTPIIYNPEFVIWLLAGTWPC
jgi:hypothetical protein